MKKITKLFLSGLLIMAGLIFYTSSYAADPPPPPTGGGSGGHNLGGNQGAPGAPIDGGLGILLALGAGFGGYKLYKARKKAKEIEEPEVNGA